MTTQREQNAPEKQFAGQVSPKTMLLLDSQWLRVTLSSIGDAVIATDSDSLIKFINPVAEALTGWAAAEAVGQPLEAVFQIVHEQTRLPGENPVSQALREGAGIGLANHTLLLARDGTERSIDNSAAPIRDEQGRIVGVVLVFRDVSEQRRLERRRNARLAITQILAQETDIETAAAKILAAVCSSLQWDAGSFWRLDPDGHVLRCREFWQESPRSLEVFREATLHQAFPVTISLPGRVWHSRQPLWVPDVVADPHFFRAPQAQEVDLHGAFACPVTAGDKFLGVLEYFSQRIQPPDDDLLEMMATIGGQFGQFIERREAEQRLRRSEQELSDFFENANVGLHWVGPEGTILRVNQAELDLLGYSCEEYVGHQIAEFHVDRPVIEDILARLARGEALRNCPARMRAKDGSIRNVLINSSVLFEDGQFTHTRCFTLDLTQAKQAQQAQARLAAIVESSEDAIISKTLDGEICSWNAGAERLFGYTAAEAVGQSIRLIIPPELYDEEDQILERLRRGESIAHYETVRIAKDGHRIDISLTISPVRDGQDRMVGVSKIARDITQRNQAQRALRESEQRFARFMQHLPGFAWIKDLEGRYVYVNEAATKAFQCPREELYGKTDEEVFPPATAAQFRANDRKALQSANGVRVIETSRQADGVVHHAVVSKFPIAGPDGRPALVGGMAVDITERKWAEAALRAKEAELALITETTPLILTRCSRDLKYRFANRSAAALFGITPDQMVGRPIVEIMGETAFAIIRPHINQVLEGQRVEFEAELPYRGVGPRWIRAVYTPDQDEQGQVTGWIASIVDVTERKRAEGALRQSEERYRAIVETQSEMVCRFRPDGCLLFVNDAYARALGTTPEALIGANFWELIAEADRPQVRALLDRLRPQSPAVQIENRLETAAGTRWTLWTNHALAFDAEGRVAEAQSSGIDITERKRMEQSLRFLAEAGKSLSSLVDYKSTLQKVAHLAVPGFADWCAVDMLNSDGSLERLAVAHVDPAKVQLAEKLYRRYPPPVDAPRGVWNVLRTGQSELASQISDAVLEEAAQDEGHLRILRELNLRSSIRSPLKTKDQIFGVITFATAESGRLYGPDDLAMAEDLAHRAAVAIDNARLYQEVRDADRRKDEFLAMLAHELRNPLAPIRSGLDILAMDAGGHDETIALMQQQVEHVVRLVDDLLDVSRIMRGKVELRKESIELAVLVRRSVAAVRPLIDSHGQELVVSIPEQPVWLHADSVRLVQVIENLLNNASKYTDAAGRVELTAEIHKDRAVIRVRDTGIGIEPELLPRVFELFTQSSRSLDRAQGGLGIGLTLVQRLVEMHGGSVSVHSDGPGQGSTFTVRLPTAEAIVPPEPVVPDPVVQSRRILVVDDNVAVTRMLSILLTKLGSHEVDVAFDGPSALVKIKAMHPEIVLLDVGLPGMDGYQVAREVRQRHKFDDVMLIALTGYGQEEDRQRSKEAGFDEHLVKPPSVDQIRAILGRSRLLD